jgi:hypothetical protein
MRAEFRGDAVLAGMTPDEKAYARGFTAGHDDAREGLAPDSTLAIEVSWYASGYRAGYAAVRAWG